MLREMDAIEWIEWQVYMGLEPFGEWRDDVRAASICTTLANVYRNPETTPEPFTLADFRLQFGDALQQAVVEKVVEEKPQTAQDMERHLMDWIEFSNARFKEGGRNA